MATALTLRGLGTEEQRAVARRAQLARKSVNSWLLGVVRAEIGVVAERRIMTEVWAIEGARDAEEIARLEREYGKRAVEQVRRAADARDRARKAGG